jgi:hypothetical protein
MDRGREAFGGEAMFADKAPIDEGDTCTAVNERSDVDSFQGVRRFNKLYWDLHRRGRGYNYSSNLGGRRVSRRRRSPF